MGSASLPVRLVCLVAACSVHLLHNAAFCADRMCAMQKAAAHRLHANALLHNHLAAMLDWAAAVPNVEVLDEQPRGQAAQQPPPQWTLPGDSVVLPASLVLTRAGQWSVAPSTPAQPAKTRPTDVDLPGVDKSEQDSDEWLPPPPPRPAQPASAIHANNADVPSQKRQRL